jgi:RNA polymerase sigma-70 factor (ECF subfamily)
MDARRTSGTGTKPGPEDNHFPHPLSVEQVVHAYAPRVYNTARRMLRSDVDAEDVTQDVLLQVVRKLPTFRGDSAFPTWLHRVTVNAALSHRRKLAVRKEDRLRGPLDFSPAEPGRRWAFPPDAQLLLRERNAFIDRAIAALPETYRTVFELSEVEGRSNAEIADALGLSVPAVKSRLHRARLLLRHALTPYFEEAAG